MVMDAVAALAGRWLGPGGSEREVAPGRLRPAEWKLPAFTSLVCAGLWAEAVR